MISLPPLLFNIIPVKSRAMINVVELNSGKWSFRLTTHIITITHTNINSTEN
jgi:hypothetical protein